MNNQPQQETDARGSRVHRFGVHSVTADIERLTETMAMLETYVDSLLDRTQRLSGVVRRSTK